MERWETGLTTEAQKLRDERALADIPAAIIIGLYLTNVASGIGGHFGLTPPVVSLVSKLLIFGALARCLLIFIDRLNVTIVFSTFLFVLATVLQQAFFPNNVQYMRGEGSFTDSTFFTFFVTVLPAVYTISVIRDFDIFLRRLQSTAVGLSTFTAGVLLLYGSKAFTQYSMGFAGAMILPSCLMVAKAGGPEEKRWKKLLDTALAAVDIFAVAIYGSRGAFIAIIGFTVYFSLWKPIRQMRPAAIAASAGLLLLAGNYKTILRAICDQMLSLGFYSRTLASLSSESVSDSGRAAGYETIWRLFKASPLKFRGINADYDVLGVYCHNWFLELLYSFGLIAGGLLCCAIIVMILSTLARGCRNSRDTVRVCLTFAFFPVCLVSGSIWLSTWFWAWVVLALQQDDGG